MAEELEAGGDPFVEALLVRGLDEPLPAGLAAKVENAVAPVVSAVRRRWLIVRGFAAALGIQFVVNGTGSAFLGRWVADNLDEPYHPHVWREGGVALLALGVLLVVAAVRPRRLLSTAALVACPAAFFYGVTGVGELDDWINGAALHISQGVLGLGLAVSFLWARRYVWRPPGE
jgi:hypothetical protein